MDVVLSVVAGRKTEYFPRSRQCIAGLGEKRQAVVRADGAPPTQIDYCRLANRRCVVEDLGHAVNNVSHASGGPILWRWCDAHQHQITAISHSAKARAGARPTST